MLLVAQRGRAEITRGDDDAFARCDLPLVAVLIMDLDACHPLAGSGQGCDGRARLHQDTKIGTGL